MLGFLGRIFGGIFGALITKLFGSKDPTLAAVSAENATNKEQLQEVVNLSNVQTQTSAARNDAILNIVRNDPAASEIHIDPNASVNTGDGAFVRPN